MNLMQKLAAVLSHLNAEENEMALEFQKELEEFVEEAQDTDLWVSCLKSAGVDNWSGYDYARDEYREAKGEED